MSMIKGDEHLYKQRTGQDRAGRPALVCDDCVLHLYFCIIVVLTLDRVCFGLYVASLNSFVLPCSDPY